MKYSQLLRDKRDKRDKSGRLVINLVYLVYLVRGRREIRSESERKPGGRLGSERRINVVDVTVMVLRSENENDVTELATVSLPGVPRVGDIVIAKGALFEVRSVTWSEELVSLTCYSTTYGYNFPMPESR
jgi:hypothetical protein